MAENAQTRPYEGFLGTWTLDPASCDYEQGLPPREGIYSIREDEGVLHFLMDWTDAEGEHHRVGFSGIPDGKPVPFEGGDLADALSITAVSPRELTSSAFYQGRELMVAQRQLDASGRAMRVIQVVRFPDGTDAANVSLYHKAALA